jgi:hypothetical protein
MSAPLALGKAGRVARTVNDIEQAQHGYGKVLGLDRHSPALARS